jgi:hypothetical protein
MSLIGWARQFENDHAITDVPERVRKTEIRYWCSLAAAVLCLSVGIALMATSQSLFGLFLAVSGVVNIALVKLWAHIRLATYQIILELQARR